MLYDTHCHLDYFLKEGKNLDVDHEDFCVLSKIINDCAKNGVRYLNTICVEIDKFEKVYNICDFFDNVYCSIGQHPLYVLKNDLQHFIDKINFYLYKEQDAIKDKKRKKIIAIGECGLDFFKIDKILGSENSNLSSNKFKEIQICFLENQIQIAKDFNLPCIIHTRDAEDETYNTFKNSNYFNGVLHSFTGSKNFMKKMLDLGFFISFSGIVTFKNATEIQENLKYCPIDRILIETDAPYLSPEPLRGAKNFPQNLIYIRDFIKNLIGYRLKNTNIEDVLYDNSQVFFARTI